MGSLQLDPLVDIPGIMQRDRAIGLEADRVGVLQSAQKMEEDKYNRGIAKENQLTGQMPELLKRIKAGDNDAFMQLANLSLPMAQMVMQREEHQQQGALRAIQMQAARANIVAQVKAQKIQEYSQGVSSAIGLQEVLRGTESVEDKKKYVKLYREDLEKRGMKIHPLFKGDWNEQFDRDLDSYAKVYGANLKALQGPQEPIKLGKDDRLIDPRTNKELVGPSQGAGGIDVEGEGKLRKEFEGGQGGFREVERSYNRIKEVVKEPSAAGDIALVFSYMKMNDPGSTVRESEYATAQNAAGVPDIVRARYNKLLDGQTLAPAQRKDFADKAKTIYKAAAGGFNQQGERYRGLAKEYGYNPDRIIKPVNVDEIVDAARPKSPEEQNRVMKFDDKGNPIP